MSIISMIISFLLVFSTNFVSATDIPRPSYQLPIMDSNTIDVIKSNIYIDISTSNSFDKQGITCYDVLEDGSYLLLYENRSIAVYNKEFAFLFSITIRDVVNKMPRFISGSYWNRNGNIMVLSRRSSSVYEIDKNGNFVNFYDYGSVDDHIQKQIDDYCDEKIRYVNEEYYSLESFNFFHGLSYLRLIKIDSEGNKTTIHDAGGIGGTLVVIVIIM